MFSIFKILIVSVFFLLSPSTIFAQEDFLVSSEVNYKINESDEAIVTHHISITNTNTLLHATDYTLILKGSEIENISAYSDTTEHEIDLTKNGENTIIKVMFTDDIVGEGAIRNFTVEYIDKQIVQRNADVLEINIPRLEDENVFESYLVRLQIPTIIGEPAYIAPEPDNTLHTDDYSTYYFNKTILNKSGVIAAFGEYQVFSFDLTYHLQNPLAIPSSVEIALPPDTSFQKITYDSLTPIPSQVSEDTDGNWLATYKLNPRERLDVRAIGTAQLFSKEWNTKSLSRDRRGRYLKETPLWQANDTKLKTIAQELKTPQVIYEYVVDTLDYNYDRVSTNTERLSALQALENPANAICTEFTDLFIALARAAGIPAREVNGYAHTDNQTLQPLSLVADVLHAWPEYWDDERNIWVPVDPTWGDTTGGLDYFSKVDMKHLAFVMHGDDPFDPIPPGSYKLGANPQKDVYVSLTSKPDIQVAEPEISLNQKNTLPFQGINLAVEIRNTGGVALYGKSVELYFDGQKQFERQIDALLPFEKRIVEFSIPYGVLGKSTPSEVVIVSGGAKYSFYPDKSPAIVRDIIFCTFILITFIIGGFLTIKKIR